MTQTDTGTRQRKRWWRVASIATFVYLTSTILVTASERVFWYWAGFNFDSVLFLGVFYLIPTAAGLWVMALAPAVQVHQIVLAGAFYAIVTEGVLTPVIYSDGPLPVLAAMFVTWHGLIAFVGFWYLVRRWLLRRDLTPLMAGSMSFGAFWGVWTLASAVGDPPNAAEALESDFDLTVLDPTNFGRYAVMVGATLVAAHWMIGFVWPTGWRPTRRATIALLVVCGVYFSIAVLPAVVWAPLKLSIMLVLTWRLLRRHQEFAPETSTVLDQMSGRVRLLDCSVLLLMPLTAASVYALMWPLQNNPQILRTTYWSFVWIQVVIGSIAYIWAWRQSRASVSRAEDVPISAVG